MKRPPSSSRRMLALRMLRRSALQPTCCGLARRALCTEVSEESKQQILKFLGAASRPKMGKAKAKQSAGQRALDLSKQAKNLDDLDMAQVLSLNGAELKKRNVPCQDRKRMLRFINKANQGFTMAGATWRSWREPKV